MQSGTALKVDESITRDWLGCFLGTSKIAEGKKNKKSTQTHTLKKKISTSYTPSKSFNFWDLGNKRGKNSALP